MKDAWKRGSARMEPGDLRDLLRDNKLHVGLGVVFKPKDADSHYELGAGEVMVHVQLQPDNNEVFCRLGAPASSTPGTGVWAIPQPGVEVGVCFPYGEIEGDPFIFCCLPSRTAPESLTETKIVVVAPAGGTVEVFDVGGSGAIDRLVKKSEFDAHTHHLTLVPVTGAVEAAPPAPVTVSGDTDTPDAVTGTEVLRAK
jgi:hypothetical protein